MPAKLLLFASPDEEYVVLSTGQEVDSEWCRDGFELRHCYTLADLGVDKVWPGDLPTDRELTANV